MEDMVEIPKSLLWGLCDQVTFASAFQAAIEFELIVLEWAFSKGYSRVVRKNKKNNGLIHPSFAKAVCYLEKDRHIPESLIKQIKAAWKIRNDLVHNFAWKSLLLGPEQSRDCILFEAQKTLKTAWFAVQDECCRNSL